MVKNIIVFPAKIKKAEDHFINGAPIGVFAINIGNIYALITITVVRKALNSTQRPL